MLETFYGEVTFDHCRIELRDLITELSWRCAVGARAEGNIKQGVPEGNYERAKAKSLSR
jgi:hypothetical protein